MSHREPDWVQGIPAIDAERVHKDRPRAVEQDIVGSSVFQAQSLSEQTVSQIQRQPARLDQHLGRPLVGIAGKVDSRMFEHQRGIPELHPGGFPGQQFIRTYYPAGFAEGAHDWRAEEEVGVFEPLFRDQA